jgi:hypothetical protein
MIWQQGQLLKSADLNSAFAQSFPASAVSAYSATVLAQIDNAHWLSLLGIPNLTTLGAPNGIATLDGAAHLTSTQVPPILPGNFSVKGPKPWIDVVGYGAVGNGIADDTGAINSAISALPATGGIIYFPPGIYLVSGTIPIVQSSVRLMGAGIGVSVIQQSSTTLDTISFGNGSTLFSYLSVSDLSIWSSVVNTAGAAIKLNDVSIVALSRVEIEGTFIGVNMLASTNVVLDSVTVKNPEVTTGTGIVINGGNNHFLDKVLVYSTSTQPLYGLQLLATDSCWVDNSHFLSTGYGIIVNPATTTVQRLTVNNTAVASCTNDGIYLNPAAGGTVQGVRFSALRSSLNSGNGVNFGTTGTITSAQLHGCQILDNALSGINLQATASTYSLFDGCYIGGNSTSASGTLSGIKVAANVNSFDIRTCRIGKSPTSAATQKYGIEIAAGTSNNYAIIGNDLNDNVTASMIDGGSGTTKQFLGNFPATAETKSVIGGTLQLSHYGAGTLLTDASGNVTAGASVAAAFVDSGNTSPAGTTSASAFVMMGIGSTASITPSVTGRILVVATGGVFSPTAACQGQGAFLMLRRGTGTAPVNGAAVTGTQISTTEQCTYDGQNFVNSFATHAIVTGLSVGVAIWLDIALESNSASFTAQVVNVKITAIEF